MNSVCNDTFKLLFRSMVPLVSQYGDVLIFTLTNSLNSWEFDFNRIIHSSQKEILINSLCFYKKLSTWFHQPFACNFCVFLFSWKVKRQPHYFIFVVTDTWKRDKICWGSQYNVMQIYNSPCVSYYQFFQDLRVSEPINLDSRCADSCFNRRHYFQWSAFKPEGNRPKIFSALVCCCVMYRGWQIWGNNCTRKEMTSQHHLSKRLIAFKNSLI